MCSTSNIWTDRLFEQYNGIYGHYIVLKYVIVDINLSQVTWPIADDQEINDPI